MSKKRLTDEYIREELAKRGFTLIGRYVNSKTKMKICDEDGYLYSISWDSFKTGTEPHMASPSNSYSIYNIRKYASQFGYELISTEYKNSNKDKLIFKCPNSHEYKVTWDIFKRGHRCSKCSGREATSETCIATTDPWMMKYLKNKEDGYNYSHGSNKKVEVICPYCGKEKEMRIAHIYNSKSISCKNCGDGVSYSEKILISLLNQLKIKYEREYRPKWSNNKRYDFYFEYNDKKYIIECHGIQHYKQTNRKGARTLEEEQENDKYKKELALNNGISEYIILDCRFSELNWIEQSITNSELSNIFDLSKIDLLKCQEFAINSNLIKEVCDCWNNKEEWKTTTDLAKIFNVSDATIRNWLKRGVVLGLCDVYNPKDELRKRSIKVGKSNGKPVEIFKDEKSLGVFMSCAELAIKSEELFGVKLSKSGISQVCREETPHHHGYTFRYITKEEYESKIS